MAAQDYASVVQQLYVSYFGRPADYYGLQNFEAALDAMGAPKTFAEVQAAVQADKAGTTALSKLVNSFNTSAESAALYGTDNTQVGVAKFVAAIYQNVLGREADVTGFNFWVNAISSGELTKANAAAAITAAATTNTTDQGKLDAKTVANKLAVATTFTANLDTPTKLTAYSGEKAAAQGVSLLQGVNSSTDLTAYQQNIEQTITGLQNVPGTSQELTTGIDSLTGTSGNDSFTATITSTSNPIGALDVVDGGAGRDTVSIADSVTLTGADFTLPTLTIRNVENLVVSTNGALGNTTTAFDISATGATDATLTAAGAGTTAGSNVKAAGTTNVNLTVGGANTATVAGGKAVVVNAGTGAVNVTGDALTTVTVNGTGAATISNGTKTTLTAVTLKGVAGDNSVTGNGVTTVNLTTSTATDATVNVTNLTTGGHALNVNVDGVGYDSTGAAVVAAPVVTDNTATSFAVKAATKANVAVAGTAATTATVAGAGALALDLSGADKLTSLDASASTGGVTLAGLAAGLVTITGGAGDDAFTTTAKTTPGGVGGDAFTTTQPAKVTFNLGAGNDVVTLGTDIAAGSTINLGAGNDKLVVDGGSIITSTSTATTVVDGGDGVDTLAASAINAGNAGQFKNFEVLGLDNSTVDVSLATGTTFTGLELLVAGGIFTGATTSQGLSVNTDVTAAGTTTLTFDSVTGTADAYTISFGSTSSGTTASPTAIHAQTVSVEGIEQINLVSGAASGTASNSITLADAAATSVVVTGGQALNVAFAASFGSSTTNKGVTSIDASAATGALTIDTTNVTANTSGLTIKGGSANDMITLAAKATVNAGAGDDTIVTGAFSSTLTGGAGKDLFNVSVATYASGNVTTITDLAAGDTIKFSSASTGFGDTKVDISAAHNLTEALNIAANGTSGHDVTWFTLSGNTYIVADNSTGTTLGTADIVVKLSGVMDLSHATIDASNIVTIV